METLPQGIGLAARYPLDAGLKSAPAVLFFEDFEGAAPQLLNVPEGRRVVEEPGLAFAGRRCLESRHVRGKMGPLNSYEKFTPCDTAFLRFYTRFEKNDFHGKGPGLDAKASGVADGSGAGIRPQGDDKFCCRIIFNADGNHTLYYYHMDMGQWGDIAKMNMGRPEPILAGRWYCFELMLKANAPGQRDGEIALWVDGQVRTHAKDIRFRNTGTLKINWVDHSMYCNLAPSDQTRWEDNIVVATSYIGPLAAKPLVA